MGVLSWLCYTVSERELQLVARQVADRSLASVWSRVQSRLEGLSLAEARGYVRVRSASIVRGELEKAYRRQRGLRRYHQALERCATDVVIHHTVWRMLREQRSETKHAMATRRAA